ncbi:MAG: aminotransferase class I/II-fold pyridoxal phosphate-dependent enzyme [Gemmatimonadaceae bacterium]
MSPTFQPFALEHYQSQWEHTVDINLADSSVKCLRTDEWLEPEEQAELLRTGLFYPQVNGTTALRERIAALYANARAEHVLVTVGAAQGNSMVCATLLEPGDEVVVISPGYRQVWGLAQIAGCTVREVPLRESLGWRLDMDELASAVGARTKLVSIVNPNNPTGSILTDREMQQVVSACAAVGAWLHADEVYTGTEHGDVSETPSFWGRYDRLICTNSLSKAYGLAGLRIGWMVADPDTIQQLWRRHEYAVIAAAAPSMTMAEWALKPSRRRTLLARQKGLTASGWAVMNEWLTTQRGRFDVAATAATAIAFVRYHLPVASYALAEQIRTQGSVLVAPGALLGAEHHLRITVGYEATKVRTALDRIAACVASPASSAP